MASQESRVSVKYVDLVSNPTLLIIILISFAGTTGAILPAALPGVASGLGIGEGTVGYLMTAYKLPSILIIPIAAALADIYGRKSVLLPSLVIFGVAGGLMFFSTSFSTLVVFALLLGIGSAAIFPLTVTLLGDFFHDENNSTAQGIRVGVIGIGIILFPAITGYLAGIKWNYPFVIFLFVLPVFGVVYFFLREPIQGKSDEKRISSIIPNYARSIKYDLSDPSLAILVSGGFARDFSRYALITFIPLFAVSVLGATLFEAGLLLSLRGVVYIVISPIAGATVIHFARKQILFGSLFISAICLVALPYSNSLLLLTIIICCHSFGDAIFDPVIKGTVTTMTRKDRRAGIVNTLYVLKRFGQTISPAVFGLLLSIFDWFILFTVAGLSVGAYLVVFLLLFRYKPVLK